MFAFSGMCSPESGSGESDPEFSYSSEFQVRHVPVLWGIWHSFVSAVQNGVSNWSTTVLTETHIKKEKEDCGLKRPRGRPPKQSREQNGSIYCTAKKSKHGKKTKKEISGRKIPTKVLNECLTSWLWLISPAPRGTHLWEFIRDILIHPERNQGLLKWEDRREGVFKFLKSEAVAQMWGQKKKNSSMTYEKLSRAMRWMIWKLFSDIEFKIFQPRFMLKIFVKRVFWVWWIIHKSIRLNIPQQYAYIWVIGRTLQISTSPIHEHLPNTNTSSYPVLELFTLPVLSSQYRKVNMSPQLTLCFSIRYYYKREILERVDGRRLVYKFGKNSNGWKMEEIGVGM